MTFFEILYAVLIMTSTPTILKGTAPNRPVWNGIASYYSESGCIGCSPTLTMANGKRLDDTKPTIAFNKLPLGAFVEVTNVSNGQAVTVEVSDTGGFESLGRIADLSLATKNVISCSDLCEVRIKEIKK